jgi:hypothetical protein
VKKHNKDPTIIFPSLALMAPPSENIVVENMIINPIPETLLIRRQTMLTIEALLYLGSVRAYFKLIKTEDVLESVGI